MKNYRAPSVTRLQSIPGITPDQCQQVRALIQGAVHTEYYESVSTWVSHCYNMPTWHERVMVAVDEVLETYGVESIYHKGELKCEYCNTGDSYAATIVYRYDTDTFLVTSWGDLVEKYNWNGEQ